MERAFAEVLNCPEPNEQAHIPEADTDLEIDTEEPSKTEICNLEMTNYQQSYSKQIET